jgi:phage terminase small subunit
MARKTTQKRAKAGNSSKETRYKLFVEAYLQNGGNVTQAAVSAGYSPRSAYNAGSRLMKVAAIRQKLAETRARSFAGMEITTDRILREVARLAFFDPRQLFDEKGDIRAIHEMDDDTAAAIASVDHEEIFAGRGENRVNVGILRKIRAWDKNAALEKLMKNSGLFEKDNSQTGPAAMRELMAALGASAGGFKVKQP